MHTETPTMGERRRPTQADAVIAAREAVSLAAFQRTQSDGEANVLVQWHPRFRSHVAITHQRMALPADDVPRLSAVFFYGARLLSHPWYDGFLGGSHTDLPTEGTPKVLRAAHVITRVDVGLRRPRAYRMLCVEHAVSETTRVVSLASSTEGGPIPAGTVEATLLVPSGDVFHHDGEALHWHHIMVAPEIGMGPRWFDRGLLRTLRSAGWDGQERRTYRDEAAAMVRFVEGTSLAAFCAEHHIDVRGH